jgi:hypothetical protein
VNIYETNLVQLYDSILPSFYEKEISPAYRRKHKEKRKRVTNYYAENDSRAPDNNKTLFSAKYPEVIMSDDDLGSEILDLTKKKKKKKENNNSVVLVKHFIITMSSLRARKSLDSLKDKALLNTIRQKLEMLEHVLVTKFGDWSLASFINDYCLIEQAPLLIGHSLYKASVDFMKKNSCL